VARIEDVLVGAEIASHLVDIAQTEVVAGQAEKAHRQEPGDDDGVIDEDHHRCRHPEDSEVLGPTPLSSRQEVEHSGRRAVTVAAAVAPDAPFDPHQGNAEQQE
jgi:hypothetical protein